MNKIMQACCVGAFSGFSVLAGTLVQAQVDRETSAGILEEVIVTARRREESIQSTPVLVNAFDNSMLVERSISTPEDLQLSTPGVYLSGSGGRLNVVNQIRGQSKAVSGTSAPAVVTYFAEVPDLTWGAYVPQHDMASIQVLKGPQGTLFGRNTTGGAILYTPQTPDHELGGYVSGTFGNYERVQVQGAVNIPLVKDRAALRLAADVHRRDGYTKNLAGFDDMDNVDYDSYRASLLLTPTESIRNVTIYDRYDMDSDGFGGVLTDVGSGIAEEALGLLSAEREQLALQKARGPFEVEPAIKQFESNERTSIVNRTEVELGALQIVNIFGYRYADVSYNVNVDGMPTIMTDGTGFGLPLQGVPVDFLLADANQKTEQYSNEFQLRGKAFEDKLDWLVGGFWLKNEPDGPQGNTVAFGHPLDNPFFPAPPLAAPAYNFITEESKAVFAHMSYNLASFAEGLEFELGVRYTDDTIESCAGAGTNTAPVQPYAPSDKASLSDCKKGLSEVIVSTSNNKVESDEVTWSIGLNWQVTDDLFTYLVTRHGYRAGGVNGPTFAGRLSPFQTFDPEYIDDIEGGVRADWRLGSVNVRTNVTAFLAKNKDVQTVVTGVQTAEAACDPTRNDNPAPISPDGDCSTSNDPAGSTFIGNFGESEIWGFEVDLAVAPTDGLILSLGYSYLDFKTTSIDTPADIAPYVGGGFELPFNNTPKETLAASLRYSLALNSRLARELVLNVDYYWTDDVHRAEIELPSYDVVNARLSLHEFIDSGLVLSVFARNLLDDEYIAASLASSPSIALQTSIFGPPQMYGAELRYDF